MVDSTPNPRPASTPAEPTRRTTPAPWLALGAVVAGGAVVASVGWDAPILPDCPWRAVTGLDCPGCGLTRGLDQLVSGHPAAALDHNVLLAVAVPLALWAWLAWAGVPLPRPRPLSGRATVAILGLLAVFALVRNLPLAGVGWLASDA